LQRISDPETRDSTRDSNSNYGISWGFAADNLIETTLDTGDIIYIKWDCEHAFSAYSMLNCYYK
jgi:hypothetical protein